jgi:lysozyme
MAIENAMDVGVVSRHSGHAVKIGAVQIQPLQRSFTMANMRYSESGLRLTKRFEGLELSAYQDQGGVWTVGYGHTGPNVHGGLTITEEQAEQLLESDVAASVTCVNRAVTAAVEQHHFDALVDFAFNLGAASLLTSTLLRHVNAGQFAEAAQQFLMWDHCKGVVVPGLLRRRQAEMEMFLQSVVELEAVGA